MPSHPLTSDLPALLNLAEVAVAAASEAGELIAGRRPVSVTAKAHPWDWVTDVDVAAEGVIRAALASTGIAILGEEEGGPDPLGPLVWTVDPIDGTVNYVLGIPMVGVNVALMAGGVPIAACTRLPFLDETYVAILGGGTWCNGMQLSVEAGGAGNGPVIHDLREVRSPGDGCPPSRKLGAASVELAWCAAGRYGAVAYERANPWDVAAGALLVTQAGGVVSTFTAVEHPMTGSFLAGHPVAVDRLARLVGAQWGSAPA